MVCRVLKIAGQPYSLGFKEPVDESDAKQAQLMNAVFDAHRMTRRLGTGLLSDEASAAGPDHAVNASDAHRRPT